MKNNLKNKKKNGTRYCPKCGGKLRKNGHDRAGKQVWLCKECGKTTRLKIDYQRRNKVVRIGLDLVLGKMTCEQVGQKYGISRTTLWRWKKEFFQILPELQITGEVYDCLLVDGKRVKGDMMLIARTPKFAVFAFFAPGETVETYQILFSAIPQPGVIVCDGNKCIESAARKTYTNPAIQRCFVHLFRYVRKQVGKNPATAAKRAISNLTAKLFTVRTKEDAAKWEKSFHKLYKKYETEINKKAPLKNPGKPKYKYYWVNKQLHYAWHHIKYALDKDMLWPFLNYPPGVVPRDTNCLEGGINSNLKQLNYVHRGMKKEDEQKMLQWDIVRKSEFGIDGFLEMYYRELKTMQNET